MALAMLAILVINDHVLKAAAPSAATGILSGVAGIAIMPLVMVAMTEIASSVLGRWRGPSLLTLAVSSLVTGLGYATVELVPLAADAYRYGWGALQWPVRAADAFVDGRGLPTIVPVAAVSDPVDLLAIAALIVPASIGRKRCSSWLYEPRPA
jgi:hypothetical protein